ncbi:MAG: histidine--tRNA ligase [Bacteroidia bacterium]
MSKPSIPQGTRDFSPEVMSKRKLIFNTIESVYASFGFMPLETPAIEHLSTLTGKYGNEGDQLLYKILNNGDYLKGIDLDSEDSKTLLPKISDKGLRYDLTVPLARYVVMNRHSIQFPFKRYQMQTVWRADRPQKGRYREFWQFDADVLGSDSMLCEADFIRIYKFVFNKLGLGSYEIHINHRKLLEAITHKADASPLFKSITVAIDKTDKIGIEGVRNELIKLGLNTSQVETIQSLLIKKPLSKELLTELESKLSDIPLAKDAFEDLNSLLELCGEDASEIILNGNLARGLDYYTGCIFEVIPTSVKLGSISGGGRYDDLTSVFGSKEKIHGIGISFGIDRIYDVMDELNLFSNQVSNFTDVLFCPMDKDAIPYILNSASSLRNSGLKVEIYPSPVKLKKQLDYANSKSIKWAIIIGDNELKNNSVTIKNLITGNQERVTKESIANHLIANH